MPSGRPIPIPMPIARPTHAWLGLAAALPLLAAPCRGGPVPEACSPPAPAAACSAPASALEGAERLLFAGHLDPNTASVADWVLLPGIGPARGQAIVAERRRRRFERPSDLARVHGIGPATVAKLRPWLRIEAPVADAGGAPPSSRVQGDR